MKHSTRIIVIGLVAIGFVLYAFNFGNPLFWDDDDWIIDNPAVHELSFENTKFLFSNDILAGVNQTSNYYRPVLMLSFAFNWVTSGDGPFGYHLVSNGLHIGAAVLLFLLLAVFLKSRAVAGITAFWWLIHPLNTEAVTYISGRGDPLSVFLMLLALVFLLRAERFAFGQLPGRDVLWRVGALAVAVLAILSRETAILFPGFVIIAFMSFIYVKERFWQALWRSLKVAWPFIATSGVYLLLRSTVLNFENTFNWHQFSNIYTESVAIRIWTFLGALFEYIRLAFLPVGLHMERNVPVLTSPALWPVPLMLFFLVVLTAHTVRQWQKGNRLLFFGSAWFFLALAPASGIAAPINALIYEHWMYVPLIGLLVIASTYVVRLYELARTHAKPLGAVLIILGVWYVGFLSFQTIRRNLLWGNTEKFYQHILSYEPENVRVLNNIANLYADEQQPERAEEYWQRAVLADPTQPAPYHNLANLARDRGDLEKARGLYLTAISKQETFHYAYRNLVSMYLDQKRFQEAAVLLLRLTELQPTDPSIYFVIGQVYHAMGEVDIAKRALERGLPLARSPEEAQAFEELLQKIE